MPFAGNYNTGQPLSQEAEMTPIPAPEPEPSDNEPSKEEQ